MRVAIPLGEVEGPIAEVRRRFWLASLLLLLIAGSAALLVSRGVSTRIHRLEEFSHRVARGDFRPLEMESGGDELDDLARAFNETAARLAETIRVLTEERNRSSAILGSMIEGVAVISPQERVVFSNRAFSQILGLDAIPIEGRPLVEVVRQSDLLSVIKRVLVEHEQVSSEVVVGTVRQRSFAVTAAPVRATGPSGAVLVLHEISELRRLERVRQDFVANVSHEFRTPLTAIQGFAETLLGGALEDPANRAAFRRDYPQSRRSAGAAYRGPAQAFANRSWQAGAGVPSGVGLPARSILCGDGAVQGRPKGTDHRRPSPRGPPERAGRLQRPARGAAKFARQRRAIHPGWRPHRSVRFVRRRAK